MSADRPDLIVWAKTVHPDGTVVAVVSAGPDGERHELHGWIDAGVTKYDAASVPPELAVLMRVAPRS